MLHRRLLLLAGPVLGWVFVSVGAMLIATGLSIWLGLSMASLLAAAIDGDGSTVAREAGASAGLLLARAGAAWLREIVISWVGIRVRRRLRSRLLTHLGDLGAGIASSHRSGELVSTIVDGVESLDPYYSRYLPSLIVAVSLPVSLVAYLWTIAPWSAFVLVIAVAMATIPARLWDATLLRRGSERWRLQQELSADFLDAIQAIPTLRVLGAAGAVGASLSGRAWRFYHATISQLRISLVESGLTGFAVHGGTAAATVIAALGAWRGDITPEQAFVVLLLSREVFRPVAELGAAWHAGYLGLTAVEGIDAFLSARPSVAFEGVDSTPVRTGGSVRFEGIGFRYRPEPGSSWAVRDLEVTIPAGATVAIIGASGSGKTTMLRLLQRMDDPEEGRILLDGRPLSGFTRGALRASMAVVSQHSSVFAGTIAENIALGDPHATPDEIVEAARFAEADEFIRGLPNGYETVLGEFGAGLSGGQRQRLAIARAVLEDRALLILDEATAHLDVRTEAAITRRLAARTARTTVVVTHRLDSVKDADLILILEDGRITRQGTYAQICRSQAFRSVEARST